MKSPSLSFLGVAIFVVCSGCQPISTSTLENSAESATTKIEKLSLELEQARLEMNRLSVELNDQKLANEKLNQELNASQQRNVEVVDQIKMLVNEFGASREQIAEMDNQLKAWTELVSNLVGPEGSVDEPSSLAPDQDDVIVNDSSDPEDD